MKPTKTGLSRRRLFQHGLFLGGAGALGGLGAMSKLARAAEEPELLSDRYYIFCYFSGGWDTLLGLDPRDPALFNEDNVSATRIQPAYDLLPTGFQDVVRVGDQMFGPYIGQLATHSDKIAVVRGMSSETLTHEAGRRRFITGKPPSGLLARGSSVATWLARYLGQNDPIPNLAVAVETYNVDQPNYASGLKVANVPDLLSALQPSAPALHPLTEVQLDAMLARFADCSDFKASPLRQGAHEGRLKAREMVGGGYDSLFDFGSPAMAELRALYGVNPNSLATAQAQALMAVTALTAGLSRSVSIQVASGLDTHFNDWATSQGPSQMAGFDLIATLIEDLESRPYGDTGDSWLDHVTIVGFSEFSRTAMLNDNEGRDHSITNACLLAGAGIKGGTVVGASSDIGLYPTKMDMATGLPSQGGEIIKPEHVMRTLFYDLGFPEGADGDISDMRVEPLKLLLKKG